ncbi:hypothetical protein AXG93_4448s1390 [Marchantia polymorpha subsp. ruderalis]|uniref:ABC transmembrane type-1 domain-containing protein n=1 Tax=Marchantia polymorpha subsp. ruderalis TaxID=1480154 RepID=A0A176VDU0_MARPO|nr:hypothetical protein AXG93_4448s1390 [Marchantia polymorpha subsp. ruderalis]
MDPSFYASLLEDGGSSEDGPSTFASSSQSGPAGGSQEIGSDIKTLIKRFYQVAIPYWYSEDKVQARIRLALVFTLTLTTTGISVAFSFLSRDFYNALANKEPQKFKKQLIYYMSAFVAGIPVFVIRDYTRELLAVRWRSWMTKHYINCYLQNRTFYNIQAQSLIDNPDQRIVHDVTSFTGTALAFALALFNAAVDLASFSGILYGIYPPLFLVLIAYSLVGTILSLLLGKGLVGLNFIQERRDADFRYNLVRVRENAESISFYGGEQRWENIIAVMPTLVDLKLMKVSRNLNFFTSGYRYFIELLPAAVVAPLYFRGEIDFGVINQSFSAFDHILGEFNDVLNRLHIAHDRPALHSAVMDGARPKIYKVDITDVFSGPENQSLPLLAIEHLTLFTPNYNVTLVEDLTFVLHEGEHLLIMGPSGSGKTSLIRAIAGLWESGRGTIKTFVASQREDDVESRRVYGEIEEEPIEEGHARKKSGMIFFLPQKPYMVIGSLRQQLLYPTWIMDADNDAMVSGQVSTYPSRPLPTDPELVDVLGRVRLSYLLRGYEELDSHREWASTLSEGEQQRIAFARLLLSKPKVAMMDESTSAMDEDNESSKGLDCP